MPSFFMCSFVAKQMLYAEASLVVMLDDMLTEHVRGRWVAADPSRHEYAKLAQRRPVFPQQ